MTKLKRKLLRLRRQLLKKIKEQTLLKSRKDKKIVLKELNVLAETYWILLRHQLKKLNQQKENQQKLQLKVKQQLQFKKKESVLKKIAIQIRTKTAIKETIQIKIIKTITIQINKIVVLNMKTNQLKKKPQTTRMI